MIHPDCIKKINGLNENNIKGAFLKVFETMSIEGDTNDAPNVTCIVPFYDEQSGLQPGDWAAELHFVIRKVEEVEEIQG